MASRPFHARAYGGDELVSLLERLGHPIHAPGGEGTVESFLRGIEVVHDQQCLVTLFLERHSGDRSYPARLSGLIREISLADSVMASYRSQFCCRFSQNSGVVPRS